MRNHILPFEKEGTMIRLFFEDEAAFGRISEIAGCWAPQGVRPLVPYHIVREHMQVYGAVDPIEGDKWFIIAPKCNSDWTSAFLETLSKHIGSDYALIAMDRAAWHTSKEVKVPENIRLFFIPARTPEMNPTEQIWPEIRRDFKNKLFRSLDHVVDQLCTSLNSISARTVQSITARQWIKDMF